MRSAIALLALLMSTTPASADEPKTPPHRPVPCSAAEYRQFASILNGCVIADHGTSGGIPRGAGCPE